MSKFVAPLLCLLLTVVEGSECSNDSKSHVVQVKGWEPDEERHRPAAFGVDINCEKPSKEEIRISFKLLKDGKAAGPDGSQQKLFKSVQKLQLNCCTNYLGANNCGQLGCGCVCEKKIPSDKPVPFSLRSDRLKNAGGGGGFSYVLTESGQVFTCGNNSKGQLGHGDLKNLSVFSHCQYLSQIKMVKVAAGWDFMLAISDAGTILSWGSNMFGQLGRDVRGGAGYDAVPAPVEHSCLGQQIDISAGLRHGLSLSECGNVYSWGHGKRGQLGSGVNCKTALVKSDHLLKVPISCQEKPIQVFAGMYHSGLLTEAGSVFMWGCNKFGQCGQNPDIHTVPVPSKVAFPAEADKSVDSIVSVTSGWTHVIAHTDSGILYSWGRGDFGQLGRVCKKPCDHIPGVVIGLSGVLNHACGSEHSLAVTENGQVYCWGWNEHSICGMEHEENILEPLRVPLFVDKHITDVGCGAGHSFCIGADVSYEGGS